MPRERFRRKDLKRPDEFVAGSWQLIEWARENSRKLGQIGAAVAVVVLAVVGVMGMRAARVRQANDDLTAALAQYRQGRYSEAATQLAEVSSRWDSTPAGRAARLFAAAAALRGNNAEAAVASIDGAADVATWPPYLRQAAAVQLGLAMEVKGDTAGAAARYAEAAGLEGPYVGTAILGEARCREAAGQKEDARKLYERFAREFPDVAETELAKSKVDALKV